MNICFVTPEFVTEKYFSGGLANYVYRVSNALISLGHEVHVVTLSNCDSTDFEYNGINVHRVKNSFSQRLLSLLTAYRLPTTAKWIACSFQIYCRLRQLHKKKSFDIVQLPNSLACGFITTLLLPVPQTVRISCYRPLWNELAGENRNLDVKAMEWMEWLQIRLSRYVYAPSYTLQQIVSNKVKNTDVQVIRTPFYLETTDWDSTVYDKDLIGKNYLLFFGRFQLHKGFHILAQAIPRFLKKHLDSYAVFVGLDTPTKFAPSMIEYTRSLCGENANQLLFIGQIPHAQLYPIIAGAKLVVLPSLIDNLPNACLEAMALGKPIIGTYSASFDEILTDEKTGFLVPANDVKSLAAKINDAWTHPKLDIIGKAARDKVKDFAPEHTIQELLNYYNEIIKIDEKRNTR